MRLAAIPALLSAPILLGVLPAGATGADVLRPSGASGGASATGHASSPVWVEREVQLMGTRLRIRILAPDRRAGLRATEEALKAIRTAESLLSTWRPDTELSRLNRTPPDRRTPISPALGSLLEEALAWSRQTGGAFDPVSGAVVDAWDLRGDGRIPSREELEAATEATGAGGFDLVDGGRAAIRLRSAAWIDAGAFGKGFALRAARRSLLESGIEQGILDFGGQIEVLGPSHPESVTLRDETSDLTSGSALRRRWTISVADPDDRSLAVATLSVGDGSVSTSGGSERFVVRDGRTWSHVVDPRTGRAVPPWGSVTVVAADPLVADILSTALFVMGPDEGMAWARGRSDVAALFLRRSSGRIDTRWNPAMERYLSINRSSTQRKE